MGGSSPPPRRSSWSWSYRVRRNSESEVRPAPRPVVQIPSPGSRPPSQHGQANVSAIRKNGPDELEAYLRARERVEEKVDERAQGSGGGRRASTDQGFPVQLIGGGPKNNHTRRSMPHPPLAFYNRGRSAHQRAYSASVAIQSSSTGHDEPHLQPPITRNRSTSLSSPAVTTVSTSFGRASLPPTAMPLAMYAPRDQDFVLRTQRAGARIQEVMDSHTTLQAPTKPGTRISTEYIPMAYADNSSLQSNHRGSWTRPRNLSNTSISTLGSSRVSNRDSLDSRPFSSSLGSSRTSIDSSPQFGSSHSPRSSSAYTHHPTQNGHSGKAFPWQRPAPIKHRRKAQPGELFAALPGHVLELMFEELRNLHFQPGTISCSTCWMRDCCSIALSASKFVKYVREALYQHIYLVGAESPQMRKRTKVEFGSRLILLRRTLRSNPNIAVIVRSLKPPATPSTATTIEYNDLVASVVMACPNLERLVGFYPSYNQSFQRIFHALSTRPKLKEMNWILDPVALQPPLPQTRPSSRSKKLQQWRQEDLRPQGTQAFLNFHRNWRQLTTLVIHGQPRSTLSPNSVLERALRSLPSLQNLVLSHLPADSFNDTNLLILPPLKKLSLSHMPGITTSGLSSMATRSASTSITTLTLIHINVESLTALARIFSNLTSLETFNIVQAYAPIMPTDEFIWLFPYLASQSLRKLHWDIPYLPTRATMADTILAKSISANGFPSLRVLRAPNDPEGVFQALCHPEERADLPTDRFRSGQFPLGVLQGHERTGSGYLHSRNSTVNRDFGAASSNNKHSSAPTSPLFPPDSLMLPRDNSNLLQSRLAAQARLETARRFPRFLINVVDENNVTAEKFAVGAFLGSIESKVSYSLKPDPLGGTDEGGGLVTVVPDLLGDCGEALVLQPQQQPEHQPERPMSRRERKKFDAADLDARTREGCTGRWNMVGGGTVSDKKDKERWWHTERGRWRGVVLS